MRSRPDSRMEVYEVPKSSGRFNMDGVAQEHMNEGLDTWTPPEPVPSLSNLESSPIRPLMDIALPGLTPSSTSGSQTGMGTSRLMSFKKVCTQRLSRDWQGRLSHSPGGNTQ